MYTMKKGGTIILAVVLLLSPPCPGDTEFRCESESILFGLPNVYAPRNQWLICMINNNIILFINNNK